MQQLEQHGHGESEYGKERMLTVDYTLKICNCKVIAREVRTYLHKNLKSHCGAMRSLSGKMEKRLVGLPTRRAAQSRSCGGADWPHGYWGERQLSERIVYALELLLFVAVFAGPAQHDFVGTFGEIPFRAIVEPNLVAF